MTGFRRSAILHCVEGTRTRRSTRLRRNSALGVFGLGTKTTLYLIGGGIAAVLLGVAFALRKEITFVVKGLTDKAKWAKYVFDEAGAAIPGASARTKAIIVAHAAYESGWGQIATAAKQANNIFNVTAGSWWLAAKKPTLVEKNGDWSYYKGTGTPPPAETPWQKDDKGRWRRRIDQVWRKYADYREAIADYWSFLGPDQNGGRYQPARAALRDGDVATFAQKLYEEGYFTLPPDQYTQQLLAIVGTVTKFLPV